MKQQHNILIVTQDKTLEEKFSSLPYFSHTYKLNKVSNVAEAIGLVLEKPNNTSPFSFIVLDLKEMLAEGKRFLEEYSPFLSINNSSSRIIFITSPENNKEASILKVLGDFDFVYTPLTEEKLFNALIDSNVVL